MVMNLGENTAYWRAKGVIPRTDSRSRAVFLEKNHKKMPCEE